jgi:NitT/TauT family transport system ATP-binding protein
MTAVPNSPYNSRLVEGGRDAGLQDALSLRDVSLTYHTDRGEIPALKDLTFGIREGEFVSILGPSGCGKSTVMKILSGLLRPTSGVATIAGVEVKGPRADVGVVFQQPTLLPWKSNLENVLVPIRAQRLPIEPNRRKALDLLDLVGLGDFSSHYPQDLSGGMQQRVGIARGLVNDPKVLLMDEPFAALDAMSRENMMAELQRIWLATRKSILFITHSIPEAVFLSDRVITFSGRPGRVVDEIAIDLPRSRDISTMSLPEFNQYCFHLRSLFNNKLPKDET